ncbi:MAG: type III secretion system chaperone, partial [Rubrivivax sp.]|nr:type III secretion system chaperone [Rubrivivax sp.]
MDASSLIAELGRRIGHADFALSDLGTAALRIDGDLQLNLEHDEDERSLVLYLRLGAPPEHGREALYARLLNANLFGRGSGGGHVGLDPARDELVLSRSLALDHTDGVALEAAVAALVDAARHLRADW